jgi:NADPH-dependent 2,4-dienoyl-CoA reductase/sulfur reductase-like enzyme
MPQAELLPRQDHRIATMGEQSTRLKRRGMFPHVGIVGAGVAGLRCAETLIECGIEVTILEGRGRIGGRVDISCGWIARKVQANAG